MKKKKILVSLLCASAIVGVSTTLAGCTENKDPDPIITPEPPVVTEYTATLKYNNGTADTTIKTVKDGDNFYFTKPTDPVKEYYVFAGWYKTADFSDSEFNFNLPVTENITLYAKFNQAYDTVNTVFDFLASAKTITADPSGNVSITSETSFGRFTVGSGARFEINKTDATKNCINTQGKKFEFVLAGNGNTNGFTIKAKWASSSTGTFQILNENGDVIVEKTGLASSTEFEVTEANLPAGTYSLNATGSVRFYAFSLSEKLPQGPTSGIELNTSAVTTKFLLGREFSSAGLATYLTYDNGRKDSIAEKDVTITTEDFTTAGEKTVTVTYQVSATETYTATYKVNVYAIESIALYDYTLNSKRETQNAQVLFNKDGKFNSDNIVAKAKCALPKANEADKTEYIEFILDDSEYTITAADLTTTGNKSVTITYTADTSITANYDIEVINAPDLKAETAVTVSVDPAAAISYDTTYNFHTINQALQFLELAKVSDNCVKTIALKSGVVYHEKVEITMPNTVLTTTGATADTTTYATIEYNVIAGRLDPSETLVHSTDGSASVSVRATAENFKAEFITFKNYYNTFDLYTKSLSESSDSQAVALLVQTDKAQIINCFLTSYHDTLYAQEGRQYYENCIIEGHTDYIFGYDTTAYFKGCTIKSIGSGAEATNGGYVVASKGNPKDAGKETYTNINYGFIFDDCNFTADENTMAGTVSLGRTWEVGMTMMVMNSDIDGHFSKEAFPDTASKNNNRYGVMKTGNNPIPSQLLEYNNTGDGAINASLADTCTVVTDITAFDSLAKIFTPYNGNTVYTTAWAGPTDKNASVVLKNVDGSVVGEFTNIGYVGSHITEAELNALITDDLIPALKAFGGFYSDAELQNKYDNKTVLAATNTIYVKWDEAAVLSPTSLNFNDFTVGDFTTENTVGPITVVGSSSKKFSVDASEKTIKDINGTDVTTVNRLKTGGAATDDGRYIKVDLSGYSGAAVLQVYAMTGSSGETRTATIYDAIVDGTNVGTVNCPSYDSADLAAAVPTLSEFILDCGKVYYIMANASINYYGINVGPVVKTQSTTSDDFGVTGPTDYTSSTLWGASGIIEIGHNEKKWTVDENSKKIILVDGTEYSTEFRLKANGSNTMRLNLANYVGYVKVEIYAMTSKNSDLTRTIQVLEDIEGATAIETFTISESSIMKFTVTLQCGKNYNLNTSNGINFYGINFTPLMSLPTES